MEDENPNQKNAEIREDMHKIGETLLEITLYLDEKYSKKEIEYIVDRLRTFPFGASPEITDAVVSLLNLIINVKTLNGQK